MDVKDLVKRRALAASFLMEHATAGKYMPLASRMLNSFLNNGPSFDESILKSIAEAVKDPDTDEKVHKYLMRDVRGAIRRHFDEVGVEPSDSELKDICRKAINNFTMTVPTDGDPFAQKKAIFLGDLQAVIGSVQQLNFVDCFKSSYSNSQYTIHIAYEIVDVYDFTNTRNHMKEYQDYRDNLAFLMFDDIQDNNRIISRSMVQWDLDLAFAIISEHKRQGLSKNLICASLLYAAQLNRLFNGIPWRVTIEDDVTVNVALAANPSQNGVIFSRQFDYAPPLRTHAMTASRKRTIPNKLNDSYELPKYLVNPGDNLTSIAASIFGKGAPWRQIYETNKRQIGSDPNMIRKGAILYIPLC